MADPVILHADDSVAVLAERALAGSDLLHTGLVLPAAVSAGHKLALRDIEAGEPILKFGQIIGCQRTRAHEKCGECDGERMLHGVAS